MGGTVLRAWRSTLHRTYHFFGDAAMHLKMSHTGKSRPQWRLFSLTLVAAALTIAVSGCRPVVRSPIEKITVSGIVTVRGNVPFTEYVLETDENTLYVLKFAPDEVEGFSTPTGLRVSGRLYRESWGGRPFAHIEVTTWKILD